jgi:hypothetical protein
MFDECGYDSGEVEQLAVNDGGSMVMGRNPDVLGWAPTGTATMRYIWINNHCGRIRGRKKRLSFTETA